MPQGDMPKVIQGVSGMSCVYFILTINPCDSLKKWVSLHITDKKTHILHLHDTLKMYMQNLYKLVLNYFPKAPYSQLNFFPFRGCP